MLYIATGNKIFRDHERRIENVVQKAVTARIINLSVKDICSVVRISRQTFYAHYANVNDVQKVQEQRLQADFKKRVGIITKREALFTIMLAFVKDNSRYFSIVLNHQDLRMLTWMIDYIRPRLVPRGATMCSYYQYRGNIKSLIQVWMLPGYTKKQHLSFFVNELLRIRVMHSQLDGMLSLTKATV